MPTIGCNDGDLAPLTYPMGIALGARFREIPKSVAN